MEPGRWLDPERKQEACKVGHDWPREERQEGSDRRITPLSRTRVFVLAPSRLLGAPEPPNPADTSAGGGQIATILQCVPATCTITAIISQKKEAKSHQ